MIRIRTGEHWKINPDYLRSLKEYKPVRGKTFTSAGVLDVLGIEIDGASFGGHLGEEPIFRLVPDLVDAVASLSSGEGTSRQVSLSESGLELVIARRGLSSASLCLLTLRRPARIVVPEVEVELASLVDAVRDCAARLISDLGAINPDLRRSPVVRGLTRGLKQLRVTGRLPAPPELRPGGARPREGAPHPRAAEVVLGFEIADDQGRLELADGREPDLHSLLVPGRVVLRDEQGDELAQAPGLVFLQFTELVRVAADLVRATEAGESQFAFAISGESRPMTIDLKSGTLLADGRSIRCPPLALARTILEAVLDFTGAVRERNPRQATNGYLTDLADRARSELGVVSELESGDLVSGTAALLRPARSPVEPPLGDGRLRRLSYRVSWRATVPGSAWGLKLAGSTLWCGSGDSARGLDATTGRERWRLSGEVACTPIDEREMIVLVPSSRVALCELATGRASWFRGDPAFSMMGAKVLRLGEGSPTRSVCAVVDARRVWAADELTGHTAWEFSPPLATKVWIAHGGPLVLVAADSGFAYALDPASGTPVWRTRVGKPLEGEPMVAGKLALFTGVVGREAWIVAVEAASGRPAFSKNVEIEECAAVLSAPRRIVVVGLEGRAPVAVGISRSGTSLWRTSLPLGRGLPAALRAGGAIFAAGRDGSACRLDDAGRVAWAKPPAGEEMAHAVAPLFRRGVLVTAGARVELLDPASGKVLHQLDAMPGLAAMESDRALGLFLADEEGGIVAYRLATHLSIVS
jgi:hypothetical protein